MPKLKAGLALLLCVFMLAACGKKGKLEQPDDTKYPREYPSR